MIDVRYRAQQRLMHRNKSGRDSNQRVGRHQQGLRHRKSVRLRHLERWSSGATHRDNFAANVRSGSKGEILAASRCFPLYPQNRTSLNAVGMSETCQQETRQPSVFVCPPTSMLTVVSPLAMKLKHPRARNRRPFVAQTSAAPKAITSDSHTRDST
jgi:hypothetical protein